MQETFQELIKVTQFQSGQQRIVQWFSKREYKIYRFPLFKSEGEALSQIGQGGLKVKQEKENNTF